MGEPGTVTCYFFFPCLFVWVRAFDSPILLHKEPAPCGARSANQKPKHTPVSAKYVGQPDISRCSSPVSDGTLKNACPNVRPNFQTFINNLTDTNIRKYSSTNHERPVYSNKMRIFHKGTLLWQAPWRSPFCNHCTSSLRRQQ